MTMSILRKEDVMEKEDPINMDIGLDKSLIEDDKRIEEEKEKEKEEDEPDIRKMIIEFLKNQGFLYTEGDQEYDDETIDIFGKDKTLIEISITTGIDNKVVNQILEAE